MHMHARQGCQACGVMRVGGTCVERGLATALTVAITLTLSNWPNHGRTAAEELSLGYGVYEVDLVNPGNGTIVAMPSNGAAQRTLARTLRVVEDPAVAGNR